MKTHATRRSLVRGFTLIEILTVLAIIGILTAILIPAVSKAQSRARLTSAVAEINSARTAAVEGAARMGGTLPITEATAATRGYDAADFSTANNAGIGRTTDAATFSAGARLDQVLLSMNPSILDGMFTSRFAPGQNPGLWPAAMGIPTWDTSNGVWIINGGNANWNAATVGLSQDGVTRMECAVVDADFDTASATAANRTVAGAGGINFLLDGVTNLSAGRVAYVVYKRVPINDALGLASELNGASLMDDSAALNPRVAQRRGRVVYPVATAGVTDVYVYLAVF